MAEADPHQGKSGLVHEVQEIAIRLLARREHSVRELRRKLRQRGFDEPVVAEVLEELQRQRLLSDRRFAEMYVRYRRDRGNGPIRIQAELRRRGVAEELIDATVDLQDPDWFRLLAEVREKRFGAALPRDSREWARQARFLQHRGFPAEQIRVLLREVTY